MGYKDKDKQREYLREWMAKRRSEWFEGKVCAHCGGTKELELDHIDPAQKIHHAIWSWRKARREIELSKCQPLCERCHMKKTLAERPQTDHGKAGMYYGRGCRCDLCKEYKRRQYERDCDLRREKARRLKEEKRMARPALVPGASLEN